MHNCCSDMHTFDPLRISHFVMKHNKMCSLPYAMTANKTYLSTYFLFKTSLFIKCMSLINKVNFKKCFSKNYKRMRLTTRVYGIYVANNNIDVYILVHKYTWTLCASHVSDLLIFHLVRHIYSYVK